MAFLTSRACTRALPLPVVSWRPVGTQGVPPTPRHSCSGNNCPGHRGLPQAQEEGLGPFRLEARGSLCPFWETRLCSDTCRLPAVPGASTGAGFRRGPEPADPHAQPSPSETQPDVAPRG